MGKVIIENKMVDKVVFDNYNVIIDNEGGEEMNFMIASEKNYKIVNKIIEILSEEQYSVREATAILM